MLVSFSVSNFRSFDEEQTFSLVASKRHAGEHEDHTLPIPDSDERVLRTAVLYGANGAGKSNLFKALRFVQKIAIETRLKNEPIDREPFLLRSTNRPSTFDIQFVAGGKLFRYWIKVDNLRVVEESLIRVRQGAETSIYERSTSLEGNVEVKPGATGAADDYAKVEALATIGGPQNQSFLATLSTTLRNLPEDLRLPIMWFEGRLRLINPEDPDHEVGRLFATDPELRVFASEFLNAASTGVDHLAATETDISQEEDAFQRPASTLAELIEERPARRTLSNGDVVVTTRSGDNLRYSLVRLTAAHRDVAGHIVPFEIAQESDGTRRLMQLIPALRTMHQIPVSYFIDEIDRSLHPMLVHDYLGFFLRSCKGKDAQLIVTTHESSLLDKGLLRRDAIWFAEKNREGATVLYPLLDFELREDIELRKNYLQGRFGAVPFLGGIERLLEQEEKPH